MFIPNVLSPLSKFFLKLLPEPLLVVRADTEAFYGLGGASLLLLHRDLKAFL